MRRLARRAFLYASLRSRRFVSEGFVKAMFSRNVRSVRARLTTRLNRRRARSIDSLSRTLMPTDKGYLKVGEQRTVQGGGAVRCEPGNLHGPRLCAV